MLFAHLKRILKLDRLRLRLLAALATNSTSPPPSRICASSPSSSPAYRQSPPPEGGTPIIAPSGFTIAYALWNLEDRGPVFIEPGAQIHQGMIVGAHTRGNDLDVNPAKGKQLTNIRTTAKDEAVCLTPPQIMSLEQAIAYIGDDELVEVAPKSIRLRKRLLDPNDRKRTGRAAAC
jgi:predicted membrane GTPase involved in stress response